MQTRDAETKHKMMNPEMRYSRMLLLTLGQRGKKKRWCHPNLGAHGRI